MKLEKLTLTFENCETVEIPGEYVGDFMVDKIKTKFEKYGLNDLKRMEIAGKVMIEIFYDDSNSINNIFNRILQYNDITKIEFIMKTDTPDELKVEVPFSFYVGWKDDKMSSGINLMQTSEVNKLNNLYIVIDKKVASKGKTVWDYFNKDMKDDKTMMSILNSHNMVDEYENSNY